jgi:hypothetical protein
VSSPVTSGALELGSLTSATTPVLMGHGLGVESAAILTRWLTDPTSRDFELNDLVVVTAMLGREFADSIELNTRFILPLLRDAAVRYVQVARAGPSSSDGIAILSDTRRPTRIHSEGAYRLEDELLANGTLPTYGSGGHRCAIRHKGEALDWVRLAIFGDRAVRAVTGYNAEETKRIARDRTYDGPGRLAEHPLAAWGWGREACEHFLTATFGVAWPKSCCSFCPFTGGSPAVLARYRRYPEAAAHALFMELVAHALNPRMTMYSRGRRLLSLIEADGNAEALALLTARLEACTWAVYRVRRVYVAPARAHREVVPLSTGTQAECTVELERIAAHARCVVEPIAGGGATVHTLQRKDKVGAEESFVVAPAVVREKRRSCFTKSWISATAPDLFSAAAA